MSIQEHLHQIIVASLPRCLVLLFIQSCAGVSHSALVMLKWLFHFIHKQAKERLVKESA